MYKFKNGKGYFNEDLPLWKEGRYKNKINRNAMIGSVYSGVYNGVKFKGILVLNYIPFCTEDVCKFEIEYNNRVSIIPCQSFIKGSLGNILGLITKEFKYNIGDCMKDSKRDIIITDRNLIKDTKYKNKEWKYYKYTCNICGWTEGLNSEYNIYKGQGCSCCTGKVVVPHINSIKAKAPWMIDLGVSEEDAIKYTPVSCKKIEVICPCCGRMKKIIISNVYSNKSIFCACSDGFSYPFKFVNELLIQLGFQFQTEASKTIFEWCGNYRYDFYIPSLNMIIETHGIQHYEESTRKGARTLQEERDNDRVKRELAFKNGILYYIELDCRESSLEWIRDVVINSRLKELFDLSRIDWNKCEEFALKNIVKEVCDYWRNRKEHETTADLMMLFCLSRGTVNKYLKKGTKLGWCDYDPSKEIKKTHFTKEILNGNKPVEIFNNGQSLGVFQSASGLARQSEELFGTTLTQASISRVARNERKSYKGFVFRYI